MKRCLSCDAAFASESWSCPVCSWEPWENGIPMFAPALAESSEHFPHEDVRRMAELEEAHFWFSARNALISWSISTHFPTVETLLEVGCGTGIVLAHLRDSLPDAALTGVDLLPVALDVARDRVPDATFAQSDVRDLPFVEEFDVVCALDVLEHVDEDGHSLRQIVRSMRAGGGVVVSVPQHSWLWSAADEYGRHRRRYSRDRAVRLFDEAGLRILRATSFMTLLLPLVVLSRMRNRRLTEDYDAFRELVLPKSVNTLLGSTMGIERQLIRRGLSFPLGSSLLLIGRKR